MSLKFTSGLTISQQIFFTTLKKIKDNVLQNYYLRLPKSKRLGGNSLKKRVKFSGYFWLTNFIKILKRECRIS